MPGDRLRHRLPATGKAAVKRRESGGNSGGRSRPRRKPARAARGYNVGVEGAYLDVAMRSIQTALYLSAPVLAVTLVIGFLISIFQAVTSIQEQTLTFVPKIFVTGLALVIFGPWMLQVMNSYTADIFGNLQHFIR
jgi:flagellar biosynthetic protein FliQ